jgi:hypothetical protein
MSTANLPISASPDADNRSDFDQTNTWCVIGSGPSGLTVLKNLSQAGIPVQGFDAASELGGNWNFHSPAGRVYRSTHLISSKRLTQFPDFPMPDDYPAYPSHEQALAYLRGYANHFDLPRLIQFNTSVERIEQAGEAWRVTLGDGTTRLFRGVIIANGHHRTPLLPELPGEFTGELLHSSAYKSHEQLVGRRVLIIGAGNSGCDIAVDAAQHAQSAAISLRRGYHFVPKFIRGIPSDEWGDWLASWHVPLWARRLLMRIIARITLGVPARMGLPAPDHRFLESHPLINSQLFYQIGHGRLQPRSSIKKISGQRVTFVDDSELEIDLIVAATGYQLDFPFIDRELLNWREGLPRLFLHAFHPTCDTLFVAGMIQPDSGQWPLTDLQAQLIVQAIQSLDQPDAREWFHRLKNSSQPDLTNGIRYLPTARHQLEVEHLSYCRVLNNTLKDYNQVIMQRHY